MIKKITLLVFFLSIYLFNPVNLHAQSCPTGTVDTDGAYLINSCCDLDQSGATYRLSRDLTLQRNRNLNGDSCFVVTSGSNITLDMGGHEVLYDTWPVTDILNPSFENGSGKFANNWTYSNAGTTGAERRQNKEFWVFGGEHSIVIPSGSPAQYIESDAVDLAGGITYRAHVFFKGQRDDVYMSINGVCDNRYSVNQLSDPIQTTGAYFSLSCDYRPAEDVSARLRIGIGASLTRDIVIDLAELRPAPSSIDPFFTAVEIDNVTLMNGIITQGNARTIGSSDGGSHIVSLRSTDGAKIYNMAIRGSGMQMMPIHVRDSDGVEIYYNPELRTSSTYTEVRDRHVAVIWLSGMPSNTRVHHNVLYTVQTGIRFNGDNIEIDNNSIHHNSLVTNGYSMAIRRPYSNLDIHDNTVTGTGRGIHITSGPNANVYDNYFDLMEYPNPEYPDVFDFDFNAFSGYCAKGIHFEGSPTGAHVYGNTVITRQYEGTYPGCSLSLTHEVTAGTTVNNTIEDNEFVFLSDYVPPDERRDGVAAFIYSNNDVNGLILRRNIYRTESRAAMKFLSVNIDVVFDSPTFINESSFSDDFRFIHNDLPGTDTFRDFNFINPTIYGGRVDIPHSANPRYWNYFISWYLTVNVIDSNGDAVDNARVVVQRSGGGVVFDDYTEEDGRFIIPLHEHETRQVNDVDGYEIVPLSDYTVTVSHEGSLLPERSVTMDRSRTVTFEFVTGEDTAAPILSDGSPSGMMPAGTTQALLSVETHENATCRYSTSSGVDYQAMLSTFASSGGTLHTSTIAGLSDGDELHFYVRCIDPRGNANSTDYVISFGIGVNVELPPGVEDDPPGGDDGTEVLAGTDGSANGIPTFVTGGCGKLSGAVHSDSGMLIVFLLIIIFISRKRQLKRR